MHWRQRRFWPQPRRNNSMRFWQLVYRAVRLQCPLCGQTRLFQNMWRMHAACSHCGCEYERERGFFLGSIYFNYGLTALITAVVYPLLLFNQIVAERTLLITVAAFVFLFPAWFFRYARSFWLAFDEFFDPRPR